MFEIRDDYEVIEFSVPYSDAIFYHIGDLHASSPHFDSDRWNKTKKLILSQPNAIIGFPGDMGDTATRNSKTNPYEATMSPHDEKTWIAEQLWELRERVVYAEPGNHEDRIFVESGQKIMFDACCMAGMPERYRDCQAFMKIGVGKGQKKPKYMGKAVHKSNNTANYDLSDTVDGIDFHVSAHIHRPKHIPLGKQVFDPYNNRITERSVEVITVGAFLTYSGSYGAKKGYRVPSKAIYKFNMSGTEKKMETTGFYI